MGKINKEKYEEILLNGEEFKSKAETKRQIKQKESDLAEEIDTFLEAIVDKFKDGLEVGDYVKVGRMKIVKKMKDDLEVIDIRIK